MKYWSLKNEKPKEEIDFRALGLREWEYRVLINRKIDTKEKIQKYFHPDAEQLHSPISMKDMVKVGNIIQKTRGKIRIVGDYDCDGVMSTTILLRGLRGLGYTVDYVIPHRREDGYGLQPDMAEAAAEDGVELLITCDNGIAQFAAIDRAKSLGLSVIVLDHHEVVQDEGKDKLPSADAVVDPHRKDCSYPFQGLCGGALSYKLIRYLYTIAGKAEDMDPDFIAYAAIATVCDVMELVEENRNLVTLGLERLNHTEQIGIRALCDACAIRSEISAYHLGFILGPTINAAGRLDTAGDAVELFVTDDPSRAKEIAAYLRELNAKRQALTQEGLARLEKQLENPKEAVQPIYILKDESIDESIAGIIAGKIKGKYHRPCIVITGAKDGLKGSGRSIEAYNMVEEIRKSEKYLSKFGGHAMACGLSLARGNYLPFKLDVIEKSRLDPRDLVPRIRLDAVLSLQDVSEDTVERLSRFAPFGNGNARPIFGATDVQLLQYRVFGKNNNVIRMDLSYNGRKYDGILFQPAEEFTDFLRRARRADGSIFMDIAYCPKIDTYGGNRKLQIQIEALRPSKKR